MIFFTAVNGFSQKSSENDFRLIDKRALQIPDSLTKTTSQIATFFNNEFSSEKERVRAIFIWVASNIQYDVENMFAINFNEKNEDRAAKALTTRRGICSNYAALFTEICLKSGIKAVIVEGYTKQNGFVDYIPHAWSAALIEGNWFLFDPTWGSGYMSGGKFMKKINNKYFKVQPSILIQSHIPFDYLLQFLNYPITNHEFYLGKTKENKSKPFFNFIDSLKFFEQQTLIDQLLSTAYRVEKNGLKNSIIFDRLRQLKMEIEVYRQNKVVNLFNTASFEYNEGIRVYNDFINFRNKQFNPKRSDEEIQSMLDSVETKLNSAKLKLNQISSSEGTTINSNNLNLVKQLSKSIEDAQFQLKEQQDWLRLYLSKGESGRDGMFNKRTIFGIPIN
ncbi:MAG: transglutaminase domain-containing protein [Chloroherpetonaceae bacterium]|nr:transglutaminase domain-containing protein [Chloroherpetonaceae bacterium]